MFVSLVSMPYRDVALVSAKPQVCIVEALMRMSG